MLAAVGVTATIAASQLAVGWANDAIDAPRDALVGRTDKPVAAGEVSRRAAAIAAAVAAVACLALAVVTAVGAGRRGPSSWRGWDWPRRWPTTGR